MTWIVGMPTMWGYSIGISDVRVTLADGSEYDCLQKIYPIAQSIALGFAGSVRIGFKMINVMKDWLHNEEPNHAWIPLETADLWPEIARAVFAAAPSTEQAGQCALIMLSADPTVVTGLGPQTYVHIFKSPDFIPIRVRTHRVSGIGSGSFIDEYKQYLEEISDNHERNFSLMKMEAGMPGGMGGILGFDLTNMIKRTNPSGISSHLHYCWVYLGKTIIKTNNHVTIGAWTALEGGSGINQPELPVKPSTVETVQGTPGRGTPFEMPKIAQSWVELEEILRTSGARTEAMVA
jgi:hypothetical protein